MDPKDTGVNPDTSNSDDDQNTEANSQNITKDDVKAIVSECIQGFAGSLKRSLKKDLDERLESVTATTTTTGTSETKTESSKGGSDPVLAELKAQNTTLQDRVKALEFENASAQQMKREALLGKVLGSHENVDPQGVDGLQDVLASQLGDRLTLNSDGKALTVQDDVDEEKFHPFETWLEAYLKTSKGAFFTKRVSTGRAEGLGGSTGKGRPPKGVRVVTQADVAQGKVKLEDIRAGKVHIAD